MLHLETRKVVLASRFAHFFGNWGILCHFFVVACTRLRRTTLKELRIVYSRLTA